MKAPITAAIAALILASAPQAHADPNDLPDIGSPAQATISLEDEYRIGRMVVRGLRDQDQILEDPEISEYVQSLGLRLSSQAQEGSQQFQFFVVKDQAINAFALPGGFIGMNAGLMLATHNESEFAGVMAHEISHVTQRHIARSIAAQSRNSIVSTAAMLAAILVGAAAGGDAAMAGIAAAQTMSLQQQVSFTRANEYEADRVGIELLSRAGFDPAGMSSFFETMARQVGAAGEADMPAIVRTHPVSTDRVAEARNRAAQMSDVDVHDGISYALTKERMRVLLTPPGTDPRDYYAATIKNEADASSAELYGKGLALMTAGEPAEAVRIFSRLRSADSTVLQYHTALGQAQLLAGERREALATLERASRLFPRNVPVTVRYAEALMRSGDPRRAHEVLLDLFNNVPPTPEQARLIAMAANSAGDVADAYYYMSEYHIMGGDLSLAVNQLQLALAVPNLSQVQRARFQARMEEIQKAMPRKQPRPQNQSREGDKGRMASASW